MEETLEVYKRPSDARFSQICLDEGSKQLLAELLAWRIGDQKRPLGAQKRLRIGLDVPTTFRFAANALAPLLGHFLWHPHQQEPRRH